MRPDPDNDAVEQLLRHNLADEAPAEVRQRASHHFYLARRELARRGGSRPTWRRFAAPLLRAGWAAAGAASGLLILAAAGLLVGRGSPTWAQVVERFGAVKSFSATIFMTDRANEPAEKFELWLSGDGRARLHHRGRAFFATRGQVTKVFDVASGAEVPIADLTPQQRREMGLSKPLRMMSTLGGVSELSLDAVLSFFSPEGLVSAPLRNAEAGIADDMEVFDVTTGRTPEWIRIWVLKTSRLPVRVRTWDPRDADSVEVLFEYIQDQPAEAFDAEAYAGVLRGGGGRTNRLYALLKDPGGRELAPEDLFRKTGYHMPEVVAVGRTSDGVVWVQSGNAVNRMPNGQWFYGFGKLEDDLGQEYFHRGVGHRATDDVAIEYFVPLNYKQDYRPPTSYTLTCWSQPDHIMQPADVVGSISLKEWQEGAPIPALFRSAPTEADCLRTVIEELRRREEWESFERLLALIPGEPETSGDALYRERQRLQLLLARDQRSEALALTTRLYPIVRDELSGESYWSAEYVVRNHVILLARSGRKEEARALCAHHIPVLRAEKSTERPLADPYARFVGDLWMGLRTAGLSEEDRAGVIGFNPKEDPRVADYLKEFGGAETVTLDKDPRFDAWREYVRNLAKLYDTRLLPEGMELLTDVAPFAGKDAYPADLPGHEGYKAWRFRGTPEDLLRQAAYGRGADPFLIDVPPELKGKEFDVPYVFRKDIPYADILARFFRKMGWEMVEKPARRAVWVARYDGRKLPSPRTVRPMRNPGRGAALAVAASGGRATAQSLFRSFAQALNYSPGGETHQPPVVIIDETGLPNEPAPGQPGAAVTLTNNYAFYSGDEAIEPTKWWFEENFGITFHEEERDVKVLTLRRAAP